MRKSYLLLFLSNIIVLSPLACVNKIHPYKMSLVNSMKLDVQMTNWQFNDINQDHVDELIVTEQFANTIQPVTIRTQSFEPLTQLNFAHALRGLRVIHNKKEDRNWLFLSYNDEEKVYLDAYRYNWGEKLTRDYFSYTPYPRTEYNKANPQGPWFGGMYPILIEDIDKDNVIDLVCIGADGFNSNPRGIFAYELHSGKLKWKFETACPIRDVLYEDFDFDGYKDFIFSTIVLKNNTFEINGTTDFHTYLGVINHMGKKLHLEKCFTGYGLTALKTADFDHDGVNEIIRVYQAWGGENREFNSAAIIKSDGSKFVTVREKAFPSLITPYSEIWVKKIGKEKEDLILLNLQGKGLTVLNRNLELVEVSKAYGNIAFRNIEAIDDINNDGKLELLLSTDDNNFIILNHNFKLMAKIANPYPTDDNVRAFIIQTGLELPKRIAITSPNRISYYNYKRQLVFFQYIYTNIKPFAIHCLPLLLCLAVFLGIKLRKANAFAKIIRKHSNLGIAYLKKDKLSGMNSFMRQILNLPAPSPTIKLADLKNAHNPMYEKIVEFKNSKLKSSSLSIQVPGEIFSAATILFYRLGHLSGKILVLLLFKKDEENTNAKLEWAEVSRRLSHHVRRHISNIMLAMNVLEHNPDPDEQAAKRAIIKDEIDRIKRFTQAFQRFTEMGEYTLKETDIVPWLENSISRFHIPDKIKVIKDWNLKSLRALIEPIRFEEVMTNLITNAVEAMPEGGTLKISLSGKEEPNGNNHVLIEVDDTGKGIAKKYLEEIWTPFFTTKQNGTGIGLPEVKKIIASMNGKIDLVSEEGIGTTVSILLKGGKA